MPATDPVSKLLHKYGPDALGWLEPKAGDSLAVVKTFQVNSALLAASSPYLRGQLVAGGGRLQQALLSTVPGLAAVSLRHRGRKLLAVVVEEHQVAAAEAVVRFIFTSDIQLSGPSSALDALLVAEQLQVRQQQQGQQ